MREDELTDLQTGQRVTARVQDEDTDGQAIASIGVLVTTGNGVTARYTDGRTVKLSRDSKADALAQSFERVYWRAGGAAQSAVLDIGTGGDLRPRPLARTIGRCKPRPGARLILRTGRLVITRAGGVVWGCRGSRTRRIADARLLGDFAPVGDRLVAYNRGGVVGTLDLVSGKRRELPGTGFAADGTTLLAGGDPGLRAFPNRPLAPGPATEPALSSDLDGTVAYWLDGAGTPQVASL